MFKTHPKASKISVSVKACYIFKPIALLCLSLAPLGGIFFTFTSVQKFRGETPVNALEQWLCWGGLLIPSSWNTRNSPCLAYFKNDIAVDFMYGTSQLQLASARN